MPSMYNACRCFRCYCPMLLSFSLLFFWCWIYMRSRFFDIPTVIVTFLHNLYGLSLGAAVLGIVKNNDCNTQLIYSRYLKKLLCFLLTMTYTALSPTKPPSNLSRSLKCSCVLRDSNLSRISCIMLWCFSASKILKFYRGFP